MTACFTRDTREGCLLHLGITHFRSSAIPKIIKQYSSHDQTVYPTLIPFVKQKSRNEMNRLEREAGQNCS